MGELIDLASYKARIEERERMPRITYSTIPAIKTEEDKIKQKIDADTLLYKRLFTFSINANLENMVMDNESQEQLDRKLFNLEISLPASVVDLVQQAVRNEFEEHAIDKVSTSL